MIKFKSLEAALSYHRIKKIAKDEVYSHVIKHILIGFEEAFTSKKVIIKRTVYVLRQQYDFVSKLTEAEVYSLVKKVYNSI